MSLSHVVPGLPLSPCGSRCAKFHPWRPSNGISVSLGIVSRCYGLRNYGILVLEMCPVFANRYDLRVSQRCGFWGAVSEKDCGCDENFIDMDRTGAHFLSADFHGDFMRISSWKTQQSSRFKVHQGKFWPFWLEVMRCVFIVGTISPCLLRVFRITWLWKTKHETWLIWMGGSLTSPVFCFCPPKSPSGP